MIQDVLARPDEAVEALLAVQHRRKAEVELDCWRFEHQYRNACRRTIKSAESQTIAILLVASTAITDRNSDETEAFVGRCVNFDVEDSYVLLALLLWSI